MQSVNGSIGDWGRFQSDDDNNTITTGKSFPSTFEMGDMSEHVSATSASATGNSIGKVVPCNPETQGDDESK